MHRSIVTGAAGFVGANLTRRLIEEGGEVHALVQPGQDRWRLHEIEPHVVLHEVALQVPDDVDAVVSSVRPDWIFHLAAHGAYPSQRDATRILESNVIGTANLLEAALRVGFNAFVNTGSSSEYGDVDHAPDEFEPLRPNSYYAIGKSAGTQLCQYVARQHDQPVLTLRLYSVYGPWEEPTRLWPRLVSEGFQRRLPPLASPRTPRDYIYVDDVIDAYLAAAAMPEVERGSIFNVGTAKQTMLAELVDLARGFFGIEDLPVWGSTPNRDWDTEVWVANIDRMVATFAWQPRVSIPEGLAAMASWMDADSAVRERYRLS